jgi:hypothetical protein
MSESLFKLTDEAQQLLELASSAEPDEEQMFQDTLEGLLAVIDKKADDYCYVMDSIKGRADIVAKEINRLRAIEDKLTNAYTRMENALKGSMTALNRPSIETDLHTIKVVKNGGKAPLILDGDVPDLYMKTEVKQSPDKEKIRKALESGEILTFAHLAERGTSLRIK